MWKRSSTASAREEWPSTRPQIGRRSASNLSSRKKTRRPSEAVPEYERYSGLRRVGGLRPLEVIFPLEGPDEPTCYAKDYMEEKQNLSAADKN